MNRGSFNWPNLISLDSSLSVISDEVSTGKKKHVPKGPIDVFTYGPRTSFKSFFGARF